jgi:hypothetical protein
MDAAEGRFRRNQPAGKVEIGTGTSPLLRNTLLDQLAKPTNAPLDCAECQACTVPLFSALCAGSAREITGWPTNVATATVIDEP